MNELVLLLSVFPVLVVWVVGVTLIGIILTFK